MRRDANQKLPVQTETTILRFDEAPDFLPLDDDDDNPMPLELVATQDFYASHSATIDENESKGWQKVRLPSVARRAPVPEHVREVCRIDCSGLAVHFRARVTITGDFKPRISNRRNASAGYPPETQTPFHADFLIVVRPSQKYLFIASYLTLLPPFRSVRDRRVCYCVQDRGLTDQDLSTLDAHVQAVVREEVRELLAGRRSPTKSAWLITPRLITQQRRSIANGAITVQWRSGDTRRTVVIDDERISNLGSVDARSAHTALGELVPIPEGPEGRSPKFDPQSIRDSYEALVSGFESMLNSVADRRWPPFRTRSSALPFVERRFGSDRRHLEAIAQWLIAGRRRPNPDALALRYLVLETDYTPQRLGQIIRKE